MNLRSPIAGMSSWHHMLVERIVDVHGNDVGLAPVQKASNVQSESCVSFACLLSRQLTVDPHGGGTQHRFKFNPHRGLTANELAELLAVSRITIFKQAKAGRIPSFRIGSLAFRPSLRRRWLRRN